MAITVSDLQARYGHLFDGETDALINLIIGEVYAELPTDRWTDETIRDRAAMLLAAHKATLERNDILQQSSALKSTDENENLVVDFINDQLPYYQQTIYGQEFLRLQKKIFGGGLFVV